MELDETDCTHNHVISRWPRGKYGARWRLDASELCEFTGWLGDTATGNESAKPYTKRGDTLEAELSAGELECNLQPLQSDRVLCRGDVGPGQWPRRYR